MSSSRRRRGVQAARGGRGCSSGPIRTQQKVSKKGKGESEKTPHRHHLHQAAACNSMPPCREYCCHSIQTECKDPHKAKLSDKHTKCTAKYQPQRKIVTNQYPEEANHQEVSLAISNLKNVSCYAQQSSTTQQDQACRATSCQHCPNAMGCNG